MEIIFKGDDREFRATVNDIYSAYQAVQDGLVAMSYSKLTAKVFVDDLKEGHEL